MPVVKSIKQSHEIVVLGESKVGKSSLLYKYNKGTAPAYIPETTGIDFISKDIDVEGTEMNLKIWDTSGQEHVRSAVVPLLYPNVKAVVFMYDITKRDSFEKLDLWMKECRSCGVPLKDIPVALVAHKCDLRDNAVVSKEEGGDDAVVSKEEGEAYAKLHDMMYFETSIFDVEGVAPVKNAFDYLAGILKFSKIGNVDDDLIIVNKNDLQKENECSFSDFISWPFRMIESLFS